MNVLDIIKMNVKSYRFVTCYMEPEDNVLFFNPKENLNINLSIAEELVSNRLDFVKNKKHYLIQQVTRISEIDYDAIQYLKSINHGFKNILGVAYVGSGQLSLQIADIFIKHHKKIPAQLFYSESDAIKWIKELREYHKVTQQ